MQQSYFVIPADRMEHIFAFKISPAAGLTFQPAVFYWAYLQWGLAGSWESLGSLTEPVTHCSTSTMVLGLNYFPPLLRPNPCSEKPVCLRVVATWTRPSLVAIKTPLLLASFTFDLLKPFQSRSITKAWLGNWSGNASRDAFQVGNRQSFSTNEAVIYMRKVKLYVEMHIWGERNFKESLALIQSHSSQSLPFPPPSSPPPSLSFFILSIPLTRSLNPTPLFFSVTAAFLWIGSMFLLSLPLQISPPLSFYLC